MTTFLSRVNRRLLLKRKATLQHHLSDRSSQARPDDFDRRRPDVNRAGIETTSKGGRVDVSAAQNYDHRDRLARGRMLSACSVHARWVFSWDFHGTDVWLLWALSLIKYTDSRRRLLGHHSWRRESRLTGG